MLAHAFGREGLQVLLSEIFSQGPAIDTGSSIARFANGSRKEREPRQIYGFKDDKRTVYGLRYSF